MTAPEAAGPVGLPAAGAADTPAGRAGALRRNAIGVPGMIFMVVAATAPLTALSSNISLSLGFGTGASTVLLLVLVGLVLAVFAAGYVVLSRYVTSAGAYQAFVEFGLGRRAGAATAFVATLAYTIAAAGMVAATGYFAALTWSALTGADVPWWAFAAVALVVTYALGVRGVEIAQHVTTGISVLQFAIIGALAVAVLVGNPDGWSVPVLSPTAAFGPGLAMTLVFCLLCFGGFEATAAYGEEARAPRRSIAVATYAALGILVVVFALGTWTLAAAFDDVRAVAAEDPGALVVTAADRYLGGWSGPVLSGLVTISFLAAAVAFHNLASRYLFALGRSGLLPRSLAAVHHRHDTPFVGCRTQAVVAMLLLVPFAVVGADPIVNLFPALSGITSLALVAMMIGCCVSLIVAALRGRVGETRWATVVAPGAAGAVLAAVLVLIVGHYAEVTGSDALVVALMPLSLVVVAAYGVVAATLRRKDES